MDCLDPIIFQMQDALSWLREKQFIQIKGTDFVITESGRDYLIEGLGPGRMPPTAPSGVPRGPKPKDGGSSMVLPLPSET